MIQPRDYKKDEVYFNPERNGIFVCLGDNKSVDTEELLRLYEVKGNFIIPITKKSSTYKNYANLRKPINLLDRLTEDRIDLMLTAKNNCISEKLVKELELRKQYKELTKTIFEKLSLNNPLEIVSKRSMLFRLTAELTIITLVVIFILTLLIINYNK